MYNWSVQAKRDQSKSVDLFFWNWRKAKFVDFIEELNYTVTRLIGSSNRNKYYQKSVSIHIFRKPPKCCCLCEIVNFWQSVSQYYTLISIHTVQVFVGFLRKPTKRVDCILELMYIYPKEMQASSILFRYIY